ncbi:MULTISPECIES: tetratricopeptide repeat protein [unclassified Streptomyces]|uniref:tetratricopeptide repeat protein n=1 Tax=unclassified Streptomyces TaxID=2593676 RepID=UPI002256AAEA|nr:MULTISPECIES: tetratricopeptide repeat protein [unclassified Streptomyces]MCX4392465.1 tetratricopeptide repeat protein [Streptomyces sp. NBC_01767]WSP45378.1 tetratricopeptide repeat protein [Streptomyces sp. NBC_01243]
MLDPTSVAAISAVLGAVGSGMANEAGKWAWESTGGVVRRIVGREVPAPVAPDEREEVARMVHDRLRTDPQLAASWTAFATRMRREPAPARAVRSDLPASIRFFTDRKEAMKQLQKEASRRADGRPRLALVHGPDGMGSSTLAVHFGAQPTRLFPDGQIYADLGGRGIGGARDAGTVLRALLRQLRVPDEEMPTGIGELGEFFRHCVADLRLLIVLDHAYSASQVRPFLTSAPGVFTILVARAPFPGIDAVRVPVGPLTDRDAVRLLTDITDKSTVAAARAALPSLLQRCGGSPYALRAAAHQLSVPTLPPRRAGTDDDPVRGAAEDNYRLLAPESARLYRLMALRDWPAFDATTAARTTGHDPDTTAELLEDLADRMLLERGSGATGSGRYHYRHAVRAHAEAAAVRDDGIAACSAALTRTLNAYADLAASAAHQALPESWRVPAPAEGRTGQTYEDRGAALDALLAESGNLVEAVRCAEESGDPATAVRLCRALWPLQLKAGHHEMLLPALRIGARLIDARRATSLDAGALHAQLAHSLTELKHWQEAETEARAAARAEAAAGHKRGHASAVEFLGLLRLRQWRYQEAYDCFEEAGGILGTMGGQDEGTGDVPRAEALLERHRGRALRGLGRREEARRYLETAQSYFRSSGDTYNTARTLTDLAETWLDEDDTDSARPLVEAAIATLDGQRATFHLVHLRRMRERCVAP